MKRIFISSVQKEFAEIRKLLKRYISKNPAYRRLFDTFVFEEDVVAKDRRADQVYLSELAGCDIYLGLIGCEYGFEDADGVSPTEREFDEATRLGLPRLVFVLDGNAFTRHPKEAVFLAKTHKSFPVNPLIADALYQTGHIERLGTGLEELFAQCRAAGLPKPKMEVFRGEFRVTIFRLKPSNKTKDADSQKSSQKSSQKILDAISDNPEITTLELANMLGISRRAVAKHIAALQSSGLLRRVGPDKGGHWKIMR